MAHLLSSQLWKSISPCVVFALKFGAIDPRRKRGCSSAIVAIVRWRREGRAANCVGRTVTNARGAERLSIDDMADISRDQDSYELKVSNECNNKYCWNAIAQYEDISNPPHCIIAGVAGQNGR